MKKLTGIAGLLTLCCIGGCAPVQKKDVGRLLKIKHSISFSGRGHGGKSYSTVEKGEAVKVSG